MQRCKSPTGYTKLKLSWWRGSGKNTTRNWRVSWWRRQNLIVVPKSLPSCHKKIKLRQHLLVNLPTLRLKSESKQLKRVKLPMIVAPVQVPFKDRRLTTQMLSSVCSTVCERIRESSYWDCSKKADIYYGYTTTTRASAISAFALKFLLYRGWKKRTDILSKLTQFMMMGFLKVARTAFSMVEANFILNILGIDWASAPWSFLL